MYLVEVREIQSTETLLDSSPAQLVCIKFKRLTASSFLNLATIVFSVFVGTRNILPSPTMTSFLHHLRVVYFYQLMSELKVMLPY